MIKACIFDLDGTLLDSLTAISHFGNEALKEMGFDTFEKDEYKRFIGNGRAKLVERMLDAQGKLNEENFNSLCKVYDRIYDAQPLYKTDAYDGIRELLSELKAKGIKLAVCSNKMHSVAYNSIKIFFGEDYFNCVYGVRDGSPVKPDPGCVLQIADELGVKTDECMFIGDTDVDILVAKNANTKSVGVLWGFRERKELENAGADYIAKKPSDILNFI